MLVEGGSLYVLKAAAIFKPSSIKSNRIVKMAEDGRCVGVLAPFDL